MTPSLRYKHSLGNILISSDNSTDAEMVKCLLTDIFSKVRISTDQQRAVQEFDKEPIDVLVLAFKTLEAAERYYLGLYRLSNIISSQPHRTVILCGKEDLSRVSELCMVGQFDDYVLFWPLNHDAPRLPMAIHLGLRELEILRKGEPTASEFAAQARRLRQLEVLLDQASTQGAKISAATASAVQTAGTDIGNYFDSLAGRLESGDLSAAIEVKDGALLKRTFARDLEVHIARPLKAASDSVKPIGQWVSDVVNNIAPHLETVRAMDAMAKSISPLILIVDDDQFLRSVLSKVLVAGNYQVATANSGPEALALLQTLRPDIVLMDIRLPCMNGIETTKRLKGTVHLARLPVIMLTGKSDTASVMESHKAGAVDFITKPIVKETLLLKVSRALGMS